MSDIRIVPIGIVISDIQYKDFVITPDLILNQKITHVKECIYCKKEMGQEQPHIMRFNWIATWCSCERVKKIKEYMQEKQYVLSAANQKYGKYFFGLWKDTLFIWKWSERTCASYMSCPDFLTYIEDEEALGILSEADFSRIRGVQQLNGVPRNANYFVDQEMDIDALIKQSKLEAQSLAKKHFFAFPPANRTPSPKMGAATFQLSTYPAEFHQRLAPFTQDLNGQYSDTIANLPGFDLIIHKAPGIVLIKKGSPILFENMDVVLAIEILKFCDIRTIGRMGQLNRWWKRVTNLEHVWRNALVYNYKTITKLKFGGYKGLVKEQLDARRPDDVGLPYNEGIYMPFYKCS